METSHEANVARSIATEIGVITGFSGRCCRPQDVEAFVDRAIARLDGLSIRPNEREQIRKRLLNVQRFLRSGEIGAAEFELCLLARNPQMPLEDG